MIFYGCVLSPSEQKDIRPNILFIAIDDLRPQLSCYGHEYMHTPNIDQLAASAIQFNRAYCQVPICGASRASLMTGTYPTRYRFTRARTRADHDLPGVRVLPAHFKSNGYYTVSNGKIFDRPDDHISSWSEPPIRYQGQYRWTDYHSKENRTLDSLHGLGNPWERLDVHDSTYFDGKIANRTISDLRRLKDSGQPFFLAMGLLKPHLPFNAPGRYWEIYDETEISLPPHQHYHPDNAPSQAFHPWTELQGYYGVSQGPLNDSLAYLLIRGYFACVSYVDAQVGKVLAALEALELANNTIVVLWGDHGWHLGEHGLWCKKYNFQEALRVPLLIRAPGYSPGQTSYVTELVDIYPTLCELTGLPVPKHIAGNSLVSVMRSPSVLQKSSAFAKWEDGMSLITDRYAYTAWMPTADSISSRMLFDLEKDPEEVDELAKQVQMSQIVDSLHRRLLLYMKEDFDKPISHGG